MQLTTATLICLITVGKIAVFSPKALAEVPNFLLNNDTDIKIENYPLVSELEPIEQAELVENSTTNLEVTAPEQTASIEFNQGAITDQTPVHTLEDADILESVDSNDTHSSVAELSAAPEKESQDTKDSETKIEDPEYLIPPRIISDSAADPFATTVPLNNVPISHLTEWEIASGFTFGDDISNNSQFNGTLSLNSQIEQSITKDNVFTIDREGSYLQLRDVRTEREVTTTRQIPRTLFGFRLQLSLTASCLFPGTDSDRQCSYTPAIETDPQSIQPDTLLPTDLLFRGEVGEVLTPESLEAIRQPGFQRGANGQEIGLDLLYPNTGSRSGNSQTNQFSADRKEDIDYSPALAFSRVRQIVRGNDQETAIARTVRGTLGILDSENNLLNLGVQLATELLPDIEPQMQGSPNPANTQINRNLFLAANSTRTPDDSFTIYHAGIGRAASLETRPDSVRDLPAVNYNSIWLGLSPVTRRSISRDLRLEATSSPRITSAAGNEGGVGDNVSFVSVINGDRFSTRELEEFYTQIYLTNFETDADLVSTQIFREETDYYPHLSLTGNITDASQSFRYYTGVIAAPTLKAYAGLDYTWNTRSGWRYGASAIGYINPDRDYYSHIQGSIAKRIRISRNANFNLFGGFKWEFDRAQQIGDINVGSRASFVRVGANTNLGSVSLGVENYLGDFLPNLVEDTLKLSLGVRFSDRVQLSGFVTPIDQSSSRTNYGVTASLRLGEGLNAPSLVAAWRNTEYDLGTDQYGRGLLSSGNVFSILFRWGTPSNPFQRSRTK